ncbi:1,4-alpha-glucan branching enzyme [Sporanaerobium hydrogeniformans]|uniref:1,4-alpha-glucan branching enzyme n=2 Tax=Sporanaerobium hydrogeniformans TaxID=3072179 RepID=A0AC61DGN4_9FIRM|nr:1,4-alpha-glucan branching enzyme [Sporanaerobium hydrogeniformans]
MENQRESLEQGNCKRPHDFLGMHPVQETNKSKWITRVFCPTATEITVVSCKDSTKTYPLKKVDSEGLFEGSIGTRKKKFLYKLMCKDKEGNTWSYIDPYQFKCTFSDFELYLFGQGTDYEVYKKMGATFREVEGVKGVRFAVWAPHAKRVSVVGSFNHWDGRRHPMRYIPEQGIWELFIPEMNSLETYKYEIKTQKGELLYKADPYARYCQLRPDNASVVYEMKPYKWKDDKWIDRRQASAYYKEAVSIYEVHIGSWRRHASGEFYTYREVADSLAKYVKEMGYTHVELMGIMEHPYDGSWGYQVTGYFAPTSRYGTPDDFKYFVDTMHRHKIGVILDWVPAHFPKDAFSLEKFDGQPLYEMANEKMSQHPHWGTLIFDYGKPQVSLFMIASALSWLDNYHIDGLRVDAVASMLYLDYGREGDYIPNKYGGRENLEAIEFFKKLNTVAYTQFPGIMMIAEESTAWPCVSHPVDEGGLGFGFKWNMGWMNDFLSYMKIDPYFRKFNHQKITFSLMYAFSENFIQVLSHDEVVHGKSSMIYKMPGTEWEKFANLRAAYGYMYMHPGKKMLFMGNEFAQTTEWNEDRELDWNLLEHQSHEQIRKFVKELNKFYKKNKALWEIRNGYENFEWIDCDNKEQSILSFIRRGPSVKDELLIIINFTPVIWKDYRVGVPSYAEYIEVLNSDAVCYGGKGITNEKVKATLQPWHGRQQSIAINIPPLGMSVFKINRLLKEPEITTLKIKGEVQATEEGK